MKNIIIVLLICLAGCQQIKHQFKGKRNYIVQMGSEVVNDTTVKNWVVFDNSDTMEITSICGKGESKLACEKGNMAWDLTRYNWAEQKRYCEGDLSRITMRGYVTKNTK